VDKAPTHLDLFSGIGGFALAAQWAGFRTIGFCEIDKYCQKVLAKNFGNEIPIWNDIRDVGFTDWGIPNCDLITGGFPCQPFSVAGKRRGAADDRAIWPEMFRVISEARPAWVLGENVPGIIPMELDNVLSDLEGIGYATRAFVIPACAVDARHRRDRLWVVGRNVSDISGERLEGCAITGNACTGGTQREEQSAGFRGAQTTTDTERTEQSRERGDSWKWRSESGCCCRWLPEPDVGRVAHGIPKRVDRLKGLGNAIVPQVAFEILSEVRRLI